ncbi:MAG: cysteinyl-tRNA synthetase [Candidatus Peregrinibacteria bacterium Greene0416_19]|nr:MAG: cysteinyl-tRNA synthetase [Candidatus Peregrinibacteria bacterium Greene0416_19]
MLLAVPLVLYNTFSKREEEFHPLQAGRVTMYTCGPTVYGRPHIGNYSSFLMADLLRRWLTVGHDVTVTQVKNITDVGHVVADRDIGEDKIEKQAREEFGEVTMDSVLGIARKYEEQYLVDEKSLNMLEPEYRPRATEFIPQMREMVEELLRKGIAYVTDDAIYFDVRKFEGYGKLSGNTLDKLAAGVRVEVNEAKRHPADFALWKFCVGVHEHHVLRWESPLGPKGETYPEGFPGWHIECSAMSRSLLGDQMDIHTGGEDNIFPHHECEIAQSESTGPSPFVRLWMHKRRIDLEGEKMSKSLGNVLTLPDIVAKGFDPLDVRYYLLSVHYRTNLKFSWKGLEDARKERQKIIEWMRAVNSDADASGHDDGMAKKTLNSFHEVMDEDLNTPAARAEIFSLMNYYYAHRPFGGRELRDYKQFAQLARDTFGCFEWTEEKIPADIQSLLNERERAREVKNFSESDRLRGEIERRGYAVKDTPQGQKIARR